MAFTTHLDAFLLILCGGTARLAGRTFDAFWRMDNRPFPKWVISLDTEPGDESIADTSLSIGLAPEEIDAIVADPSAHGPVAEIMVQRYQHLLRKESIKNGSRTMRLLTQLAVEVHMESLVEGIYRATLGLMRRSAVRVIHPILCSSTGGGAGSALVPLLGDLFANSDFRARITEGFSPNILDTPVAAVTEPFAYAIRNKKQHANKILANAMAFRIETALLEERGAFQYVFHQGLANEGGAVLDRQEEICKTLGTGVYQLCRNWQSYIKPRFVDTVDAHIVTDRYRGLDIPEMHVPSSEHPVYASKLPERRKHHRILTLRNGNSHHADGKNY